MLLRHIARPLFASWFVVEAVDGIRHPAAHATAVREGVAALRGRTRRIPALNDVLDTALTSMGDRQLGVVVQAHGAATVAAAGALALGKAPRTAALALAALTVPVVLTSLPARRTPAGTPDEGEADRRHKFWFSLTALGGALLAAGDLAGRPGMTWRIHAAREAKAAAREE
ncbi:MAG TPA: DoxX family protein [Cellulomonas sp.]